MGGASRVRGWGKVVSGWGKRGVGGARGWVKCLSVNSNGIHTTGQSQVVLCPIAIKDRESTDTHQSDTAVCAAALLSLLRTLSIVSW